LTAFGQYDAVERVNIVTDRDTGQPRGFAFVEMTERQEAETAISRLNGAENAVLSISLEVGAFSG
jgi:RNA recognition motif-containing protein